MTFNTDKCHSTSDVRDLCYDVVVPEGFKCKFAPTPQGLNAHKVDQNSKGNIFGKKSSNSCGNNANVFGGSSHVVIQDNKETKQVTFDDVVETASS